MSPPELIFYAQLFAATSWFLVIVYFLPEVLLVLAGKATPMPIFCMLWAFNGVTQITYTIRSIKFHKTISVTSAIETNWYIAPSIMSGAIALALIVFSMVHYRHKVK